MKAFLALTAGALLLLTAGCEVESGYGGGYGVVGEYPETYYSPAYPAPIYPYGYHGPVYDRDYYFDRHHYWDRHRWHHDDD